jgi:hypothetical protein
MKLDKLLRIVLPELRGRLPERRPIWRAFLKDHPPGCMWVNGMDFGRIMADFWQTGIPGELAFFTVAKVFEGWYRDAKAGWRKGETSRQRSIAGKWKRKKRRARPPIKKLGEALLT